MLKHNNDICLCLCLCAYVYLLWFSSVCDQVTK